MTGSRKLVTGCRVDRPGCCGAACPRSVCGPVCGPIHTPCDVWIRGARGCAAPSVVEQIAHELGVFRLVHLLVVLDHLLEIELLPLTVDRVHISSLVAGPDTCERGR